MNVSEQIISVIDNLCQKFGIVIDWTSENVIPYLEVLCGKFIKWEITTSIFWIAFTGLLTLVLWLVLKPLLKKANENQWCDDEVCIPAIIFAVITAICTTAFVFVIGFQSYDIIEAITFPEKTIYDYISGLINAK